MRDGEVWSGKGLFVPDLNAFLAISNQKIVAWLYSSAQELVTDARKKTKKSWAFAQSGMNELLRKLLTKKNKLERGEEAREEENIPKTTLRWRMYRELSVHS